jgi:hypothetical protein
MLCRQMYTVLCYLTQFLLNAAQHVSSLYKAQLQELQQIYSESRMIVTDINNQVHLTAF